MCGDPKETVVEHDGLRLAALDWGGDGNEPLAAAAPQRVLRRALRPARRAADRQVPPDRHRPARRTARRTSPSERAGFAFDTYGRRRARRARPARRRRGASRSASRSVVASGRSSTRTGPGSCATSCCARAIAFDADRIRARSNAPRTSAAHPENTWRTMRAQAQARLARSGHRARVGTRGRPPFDVVAPEALDAYLRWGFFDRPDGQVELACTPEDEATQFEVAMHGNGAPAAGSHLAELSCGVTVINGDSSNLPASWFAAQAEATGTPLRDRGRRPTSSCRRTPTGPRRSCASTSPDRSAAQQREHVHGVGKALQRPAPCRLEPERVGPALRLDREVGGREHLVRHGHVGESGGEVDLDAVVVAAAGDEVAVRRRPRAA